MYDKKADCGAFQTHALQDGIKVGDPLIDNRFESAQKKRPLLDSHER